MANEDDVVQVLVFDDPPDVLDVQVKVDSRRVQQLGQVGVLSHSA